MSPIVAKYLESHIGGVCALDEYPFWLLMNELLGNQEEYDIQNLEPLGCECENINDIEWMPSSVGVVFEKGTVIIKMTSAVLQGGEITDEDAISNLELWSYGEETFGDGLCLEEVVTLETLLHREGVSLSSILEDHEDALHDQDIVRIAVDFGITEFVILCPNVGEIETVGYDTLENLMADNDSVMWTSLMKRVKDVCKLKDSSKIKVGSWHGRGLVRVVMLHDKC